MKKYFLLLFSIFSLFATSQNTDTEFAVYNVLSGSVLGGIGALINKDHNEAFWKTLWRGSSQGAVGGYLVFESKRLVREFSRKEDFGYIWPSKVLNSMGNSIILNGASNNKFGQTWYFNIGFGHFRYDATDENKFKTRILPFSLSSAIYGFSKGKLNLNRSLKTGTFVFETRERFQDSYGFTYVNSIYLWKDIPDKRRFEGRIFDAIAHEIIHTYQYEGTFSMNAYLNTPIQNWNLKNSGFQSFYNKYFYTDFHFVYHLGFIGVEELLNTPENDRLIEREPIYWGNDSTN